MLFNYSTTVPASTSVGWIQDMLARAGAQSVMLDYVNHEPSAVSFRLKCRDIEMAFRLPCNHAGVLAVLSREPKIPNRLKCDAHARRVAWRTLHDWLKAQLALVEVGVATVDQVMLPYAITLTGETLYERLSHEHFQQLALPAPSGS